MSRYLLILFFLVPSIFSQTIPEKFFDALIYDKVEISDYINKDELKHSSRLGIEYTGVKNKILIGYELPDEIKSGISSDKYKYEINELPLADTYTEVTFNVPAANYSRKYYFDNGFVTNSTYCPWLWEKKESKYFAFRIEEPMYFNDYCIKRLDDFVDMIADTLGFTISERRILEKEKIGYVFCKDENSVEKITGFKAKGMAMLGSDVVVTSYQTHFHEVAHILINYKLKKSGLYTLPFFMEGFAVAVGGRGGMASRVVTDLGYYLEKSGILTYDSILTNEGFYNNDASMSYAVAGLYNTFLLSELGGKKYMELYKKVNGDLEFVKEISDDIIDPSAKVNFREFLVTYRNNQMFECDILKLKNDNCQMIIGVGTICDEGNMLHCKIYSGMVFGDTLTKVEKNYQSRIYSSNHFREVYNNAFNYLITSNETTIKVYDLFNDEIIGVFEKSFSLNDQIVLDKSFNEFGVYKNIFRGNFHLNILSSKTNP